MNFKLEVYEHAHGDQPVLRWLREELTPTQRRAIGVAMAILDHALIQSRQRYRTLALSVAVQCS
jgi:hypothetical protein